MPERPAPDVPDSWFHAVRQQPADAETLADWWQQFDDPVLTQLVRKALNNNRDIRLAMLRVDTARAQLRQARAGLFPTFALPGSASRQWIENNNEPNPNSPIGQFIPDEDVITFDTWELALQASWELDIFALPGREPTVRASRFARRKPKPSPRGWRWPPMLHRVTCRCARSRGSGRCC